MTTTPPTTDDTKAEPWTAERLDGILTAVVYEHFTNHLGTFTFSSHGHGEEEYELIEPDDPDEEFGDTLTFERKSDGARFDVEFWANVSAVSQ